MSHPHFVLVGFPNSGKSTLFNKLTNSNQKTGNWTGVTVSAKQASLILPCGGVLTDLPGVPSLAGSHETSQDRQESYKFLRDNDVDGIINVIDATQLSRQLYLTSQVLELEKPTLVLLNKADQIDNADEIASRLKSELGCEVVALNSHESSVVETLGRVLNKPLQLPTSLFLSVAKPFAEDIPIEPSERLHWEIDAAANAGCDCKSDDTRSALTEARQQAVAKVMHGMPDIEAKRVSLSDKLDSVILNPIAGIPVFLLSMYLLFMFAINVGSSFIDFFDIMAGAIFVEYPVHWLEGLGTPAWLLTIIEGIGAGIQTVATFIPVIACLFIGLSILESSGYLARAAFVVDGVMQRIGLPGKAFVPLIVGFGCTVPAVMAARVMDSERERITTVMMSPFMSCGARLPVYALFAAAFFPDNGQNLVFLLYLIGIAAAVLTGLMLKRTVLPGDSSLSIMELPLYEVPSIVHLTKRVWQRTKSFITGAGQTIVVVVAILNFFNSLGMDGEFGHHDSDTSILSQTSQVITPVLAPMGIEEDNWQAGVGIITGLFAKEALVATFNALYSEGAEEGDGPATLAEYWDDATVSIVDNLGGMQPQDPLNVDVGDVTDLAVAAKEQEVELTTFSSMQQAFTGQLGAFSYLLFILLYTPCAAAMGAIRNEVGNAWAGFAALWSFTLAYLAATLCYQVGMLGATPLVSSIYIVASLAGFAAIYAWLKYRASKILSIPVSVKYSG